jgi:hypothetical protein
MLTRARDLRLTKARGLLIRARGIVPVKAGLMNRARDLMLTKARGMIIRARGIVPVKARVHVDQSTGSKADQSTGYGNQSTGLCWSKQGLRPEHGILLTKAWGIAKQTVGYCLSEHGIQLAKALAQVHQRIGYY